MIIHNIELSVKTVKTTERFDSSLTAYTIWPDYFNGTTVSVATPFWHGHKVDIALATMILSVWCGRGLGGNLVDGLGDIVDVLRGDTGDGDTSVLGQVDVEVLGKTLHLKMLIRH